MSLCLSSACYIPVATTSLTSSTPLCFKYLQITNGNLRATSLAKAEVFEEPTDPVSSYKQCVLDNCALKKPKDTDAQKLTEEELKIFFEQCVSDCRGPDDASRAAVDEAYSPECSVECADDAAGELKEVSKDCDSKKDIQCEKCNGLEEGEELDKCEEELDDCEECEKEVEEAQRSVQKASDKLEEW